MAWKKEEGKLVYSTTNGIWAEVNQSGKRWSYEVTNGKTCFHAGKGFISEGEAKDAAKTTYDSLVSPPPKIEPESPDDDLYEVRLPGWAKPELTHAKSALQALGHTLAKNRNYQYGNLTVGQNLENLRLIFAAIRDEAKIRKKP